MKILLTTESYMPNIDGGAIAQHRLVTELAKKGHEIRIVAPGNKNKKIQETDEENGTTIYRPRSHILPGYMNGRYHFTIFPLTYIEEIINDFKPDLINTCSPYPNSLSAHTIARKKGIPVVGCIHMLPENMLSPWMHKRYYPIIQNISWNYLVNYYNRVDNATVPTRTGGEMYKKHGLKKDPTPISNGVNTKMFKPTNDGDYLKKRFNLPEDKKIAIYTGRICAEKNLDVLIKAIPKALEETKDLHFLFGGSGGTYKNQMQELARTLGVEKNTTFTDFLPWEDYPNIYKTGHLFIMPGENELQSIVTLEAVATGLPAIVVDKGAVPELVENNNGYIFKSQKSDDLADKIVRIVTDDRLSRKMSANSLELVKKHSMDYVAGRFEEIYSRTLDECSSDT